MTLKIIVTTWYLFTPIPKQRLKALAEELRSFAVEHNIGGLILIASEGINGTAAGSPADVQRFKSFVTEKLNYYGGQSVVLTWKDSPADKQPFRRFKVDLRAEIVALKQDSVNQIVPEENGHLSPQAWEEFLAVNPDVTVLDTRNHYETQIGKFEAAIDPQIKTFQELPAYLASSDISRDKPLLMYCTGGIRCEKASVAAKQLGFKRVYQLSGGILAYLQAFPGRSFKGECFVFDSRVAVDQDLAPSSRFRLCPHCGDPADQTSGSVECEYCGTSGCVCEKCLQVSHRRACSKNCAHHLERGSAQRFCMAAESAPRSQSQ